MITWRNDMKCKRTVLPLLGTAFEPGRLADTLNEFEDEELAEIAQAEAYFFSAQAEACVKIVEKYLNSEDVILRMPADMLYTFANLTLGDAMAAQMAREDVHICLQKEVTDLLTPVEFSIAMLACRDWTNKCQFSENRR